MFQCYKWFWSCLPLWTAACLHSVSYTTLFFWHPHAGNPAMQMQDTWLSHLLLLWTFLQMTQQSTAVTLISESYWNHYSLLRWAELNHMSLHPDKSIFMLITTRQKRQNLPLKCPPISIGNQTVSEVDNHQVLGVTIDYSLSWSSHVTM